MNEEILKAITEKICNDFHIEIFKSSFELSMIVAEEHDGKIFLPYRMSFFYTRHGPLIDGKTSVEEAILRYGEDFIFAFISVCKFINETLASLSDGNSYEANFYHIGLGEIRFAVKVGMPILRNVVIHVKEKQQLKVSPDPTQPTYKDMK